MISMKLKIYFLALIFPIILLAQEQPEIILLEKYTFKQVGQMAIFPGCENVDPNDKAKLTQCMSQKLNEQLGDYLSNFSGNFADDGFSTAYAKVRFLVSKEGKIIEVKALQDSTTSEANRRLGKATEIAFEKFASKLPHIHPALLEDDGTPVNLQFDLPVTFKSIGGGLNRMKWKELTLFTLKDEESTIEIRELRDKPNAYIAYDTTHNKEVKLKEFNSLQEVFSPESYQSKLKPLGERQLMAEKQIGLQYIRIYYSAADQNSFDIFSVENDQEKLRETVSFEELQVSDLYCKVLIRN